MQWNQTRREFLTGAVGANVAVLLAPEWLQARADMEDPRVAEVLSGTIGIDMHNHVYPAGTEPHPASLELPHPRNQARCIPALGVDWLSKNWARLLATNAGW